MVRILKIQKKKEKNVIRSNSIHHHNNRRRTGVREWRIAGQLSHLNFDFEVTTTMKVKENNILFSNRGVSTAILR